MHPSWFQAPGRTTCLSSRRVLSPCALCLITLNATHDQTTGTTQTHDQNEDDTKDDDVQDDDDTLLIPSQLMLILHYTKATTSSALVPRAATRVSHDTLILGVTTSPSQHRHKTTFFQVGKRPERSTVFDSSFCIERNSFANQGATPQALSPLNASQRFVYRELAERVTIVIVIAVGDIPLRLYSVMRQNREKQKQKQKQCTGECEGRYVVDGSFEEISLPALRKAVWNVHSMGQFLLPRGHSPAPCTGRRSHSLRRVERDEMPVGAQPVPREELPTSAPGPTYFSC